MNTENDIINYNNIQRIVQKYLGCRAGTIQKIEKAANNTVYSVEVSGEKYIFKLYRGKDWPENGKIPFVYRMLVKYKVPCAELIEFSRDDEKYPAGYLIEREVQGTAADTVSFDRKQETVFYAKLAKLLSSVHSISMKNFGWIGDGEPEYDSMLSFFQDEFDDRTQELIDNQIYTAAEISKMRDRFFETLKKFSDLPAVLCHGDLSQKNVIVSESGELVLIDWDDAMAYNWMADIARMTFNMKFNYDKQDYSFFKKTFIEHYSTKYGKSEFEIFEKTFHIYIGLDSLIYHINMGNNDMARHIKEYLNEIMSSELDSLKKPEIKYFSEGTISEKHLKDISIIDETCLSNDGKDPEIDMYDWGAPQDGMFLLLDDNRVVGRAAVHKTISEYCGLQYCLGGFGGLAVLPEYRGNGYGRQLAEAALKKAFEIGVDVACMCVDTESGITDFYKRLGFCFLDRPAYFINWNDKEKSDNTVMIMGLNNKELAESILNTNHKFHYGENRGHW